MSLEGKVVAQNALIAAALETARVVRLPCFWWLGQRSDPYIPMPGLFCSLFHYSHGHPEPGLAAQAACQPQGIAGPQFPNLQSHFAGLWWAGTEIWGLRNSTFSSLCCSWGMTRAWEHREELLRALWRAHTKTLPESGYIRNQNLTLTQGNPFNSETGKSVLFYADETIRRYDFLDDVINYTYWSE